MLIAQDTGAGRFVVKAYEPGRLQINDQLFMQPVLLTPQHITTTNLSPSIECLVESDLEALLSTDADVFLLGTGTKQQFPPMSLMKVAYQRGKTIEVMDTRAASHTFVVLSAEARKVAALLFL